MGEFVEALSQNGDSGHTYRFRRRNGQRLSPETFGEDLSSIERRLGRCAAMSTLEYGKEGPVGVIKLDPEISAEEASMLTGLRIAIETGINDAIIV